MVQINFSGKTAKYLFISKKIVIFIDDLDKRFENVVDDFYRVYKNNVNDLTSLVPQCDYVDMDSIGGSIYNTTPMYQI